MTKLILLIALFVTMSLESACSVNPATGRTQFAGLMSPAQEVQVGADEHPKIIAEFGEYDERGIQDYVRKIGARVTQDTERPDVQYKFTVLDTPMVNAFALPGGYIYITRGLLALANSEAEVAAVLAHEAGHITGRHSAERYSRGVVTSLGAGILSSVVDRSGVSQALGLGADLYMKSYSRDQEFEADALGLRYMARAGYDPHAMVSFLESLQRATALEKQIAGGGPDSPISQYFSTHPATMDRVQRTAAEAAQAFTGDTLINRDVYLQQIDGITYGDSARQGFIREQSFYHPEIGFGFTVPEGFQLINGATEVVAKGPGNSVILFDMAANKQNADPYTYLTQIWMKGEPLANPENISINGMRAATAAFAGQVNGRASTIRLVAIEYAPNRLARFQIGIPNGAPADLIEALKLATYSFHKLTAEEKANLKPYRLRVYQAGPGETVASIAAKQPLAQYSEARFRVLNALPQGQEVRAGEIYKIVTR